MEIFKSKYAMLGALVGIIAIVVSAVCLAEGPFHQPNNVESFKDTIVDKAKGVISTLKGEEKQVQKPRQQFNIDVVLATIVYVLGGVSILLGVLSFVAKENLRASGSAVALGILALVFELFAMYVILVLVVFLVIWYVGQYLDF